MPNLAPVLPRQKSSPPAAAVRGQTPVPPRQGRLAQRSLFALFNVAIVLMLGIGLVSNDETLPGPACFVLLLAFVCSSPLLLARSFKGRFALGIVFLMTYFFIFALQDLHGVLIGVPVALASRGRLFTAGELVILISAVAFLLGYLCSLGLFSAARIGVCRREWSTPAIRSLGIAFWLIGFTSVYFVQTDFKLIITHPILNQFSGLISLLRLLNPIGALMIAYLHITKRQRFALPLFLFFCLMDFFLGFYGDTKEQAFRDPILYLFARYLLGGRIPLGMATLVLVMTPLPFSFFAEFRDALHTERLSRWNATAEVAGSMLLSLGSFTEFEKRYAGGLQYLAERTSLKPSVEVILSKTGVAVPFQNGKTIEVIAYALIPRNFLPDKPDSTVGRIFNRAFHLSADPDTYISPSQNGELYWNYGWPGVLFGMLLIGALVGFTNCQVNLERFTTLPRLLILLMSVYLVCLHFEDGIAVTYTYWLRIVLLLLLVDLMVPKVPQAGTVPGARQRAGRGLGR